MAEVCRVLQGLFYHYHHLYLFRTQHEA